VPRVTGVGATRVLPLGGYAWTGDLFVEGREGGQAAELRHKTVTPGYLEALGLRLVDGRQFTQADDAAAAPRVMVNATLAERVFPGQRAVGRRIYFDEGGAAAASVIIGVVADEKQDGLNEGAVPEVYESHLQSAASEMFIVMRGSGDPLALVEGLRAAVKAVDPGVALSDIAPMRDLVAASLARERFSATLVSVFGAAALLLAGVGIYGLAAFLVASRMREVGVRLALGASRADVFALVLRQNLGLAAFGLAIGIALAVPLARAIGALLYGVGPRDPASYLAAAAVLLATAVAASLVPARRAVRIDPAAALRAE
jgi:predicted permease